MSQEASLHYISKKKRKERGRRREGREGRERKEKMDEEQEETEEEKEGRENEEDDGEEENEEEEKGREEKEKRERKEGEGGLLFFGIREMGNEGWITWVGIEAQVCSSPLTELVTWLLRFALFLLLMRREHRSKCNNTVPGGLLLLSDTFFCGCDLRGARSGPLRFHPNGPHSARSSHSPICL